MELPLPTSVQLPAPSVIPALSMATLCVCGGARGLVQRGSARLLVGGSLLGGAFAFSSHCLATGQEQRGYRFATATSAILTAVMAQRLMKSRAQFPMRCWRRWRVQQAPRNTGTCGWRSEGGWVGLVSSGAAQRHGAARAEENIVVQYC